MADNLYSSPGLSTRTLVYAEMDMLEYAGPITVLDRFGMMKQMPKNKTQTIKWRRPRVFDPVTTPLAEGVTPNPTSFSYEDVTGVLKQYGQTSTVTDVIEDTHEDPVFQDIVQQLGDNWARTREALTWAELRAGTAVTYANGSLRTDVNTVLSLSKQRAVTRALKRNKAKKITRMLDGSPNYKTTPVEASYIAFAHTDLENDIRSLPGFTPTVEYGTKQQLSMYEIGAVDDVRYILSPDLGYWADAGGTPTNVVSTSGSSADVYPIVYIGMESYGCVALRGQGAVSPTIIPVNQKTKDDPLGQRGVAGWKSWFVCKILNQLWLRRLEVAATSL